ncbi:MAG: tetratricopeptide repeat protein [Methanothrix sp.]|nr:tetratricopeptide repeat protein [Methanothrix sp.]
MSVQETPDAKKRDWREKGDALLAKGKYNDAIKAYDKAIKINPRLSDVWYNKGYALDILGKLENAIKAFDKAIEINPQDPDVWYNKSNALRLLGHTKEAYEALVKAKELKHNISRRTKDFCRRHHIRRLSIFGSVLRDNFGPESDGDVLVEFEPGHTPGLSFFGMEEELSQIIGRKVDLNTSGFLSPYFRDRNRRKLRGHGVPHRRSARRPGNNLREAVHLSAAFSPTSGPGWTCSCGHFLSPEEVELIVRVLEQEPEILPELRMLSVARVLGKTEAARVTGEGEACFTTIIVDLAALRCSYRHPSKLRAMCLCEGLCYEMEQRQSFPFAGYSNSNDFL